MTAVAERVTEFLREQRSLAVTEAFVYRLIRVYSGLCVFALAVRILVGLETWLVLALVVLGPFLVLLSYRLRPVAVPLARADEALGAGGALAAWATHDACPERELVGRDLGLLLGRSPVEARGGTRLKRVSKRLLRIAILLLLAILILPGGKPGDGTGVSIGVGQRNAPVPGTLRDTGQQGRGGRDAQSSQQGAGGKRTEKQNETKTDEKSKDEPVEQQARAKMVQDGGDAPGSGGSSNRDDSSSAGGDQSPTPQTEWKRQLERALERGVLPDFEAAWLTLYGRLLESSKPGKTRSRGKR